MFDGLRLALIRRLEKLTGQDKPSPAAPRDSNLAETLRKEGNALIAEERYGAAEKCFREGLTLQADDPKLLVCLGYVLKEQERYAESRVVLRRAINLGGMTPEAYEARYLLAQISEAQSDPEDAIRQLVSALSLKPDFTRACADLIRLLRQTGRESEVRDVLANSVNKCPDCLDYRLWLAEVSADTMNYIETVEHLTAVIRLGGGNVRIYLTIGAALCRIDRFEEATDYFQQALALDPSVAHEVFYHQGYFHSRLGHSADAIAFFRKSIELQPGYLAPHHLLLFNLCFAEPHTSGRYKEAAIFFNRMVRAETSAQGSHPTIEVNAGNRPLRVGFSCGEFHNHPVYYFLIGVLEHFDRSKFELFAYSNNLVHDKATEHLKEKMDHWFDIRELPDDSAAQLIRSHGIDILIDLCGHSGETRLPVFARRPAPIQVAWLGYFASTGLEEMDYIIADPISVPEDSTEWFSEAVAYLPATRLCMNKPNPSQEIPVGPLPCLHRGHITFGSFQQAAKITPQVMVAWSQVLAAVPRSRLRLQSFSLGSETVRKRITDGLQAAGIDLQRVDVFGSTGLEDYLAVHNEVDMLIDTFPYTGGTTTAFALWMGVPIITMTGNTMLARQGAAMLSCVGLANWVACDMDDYVRKAKEFSANVEYLAQIRSSLRETAESSPLFDTGTFTRDLESLLEGLVIQGRVEH